MPAAPDWDAGRAFARLVPEPWSGHTWRLHRRRFQANDHGGSLLFTARFNRGSDEFPEEQTWPALYLALAPEVSLAEILRHVTPEELSILNDRRLSELEVTLEAVLDCRNPAAIGLVHEDLVDDYDFTVTHEIAAAAIARGVEGILVPSATGLGDNLVIFPSTLRGSSSLTIVGSRDPPR